MCMGSGWTKVVILRQALFLKNMLKNKREIKRKLVIGTSYQIWPREKTQWEKSALAESSYSVSASSMLALVEGLSLHLLDGYHRLLRDAEIGQCGNPPLELMVKEGVLPHYDMA